MEDFLKVFVGHHFETIKTPKKKKKKATKYFLKDSEVGGDGIQLKPSKVPASGLQELTLIYLCDKEISGKSLLNSLEKVRCRGKEVIVSKILNMDEK